MDLTTRYLGLELANPLIPSASPLSRSLDSARRLEDAGASAIVMYSLFEEEIIDEEQALARFLHYQDIGDPEASSYLPMPDTFKSAVDRYLDQLAILKASLGIPVIASLNGLTRGGWIHYGKDLQEAGADALELNVYHIAADPGESPAEVEGHYLDLLEDLKGRVSVPIAMKIGSQFSALPHFLQRLEGAGAAGVVMFNRFYQPSIDLKTLKVVPQLALSTSAESLLAMRWIGLVRDHVRLSLGATGGIHSASDVIKMVLAGADATQLCSTLLQHGPGQLATILSDLRSWMEQNEYDSLSQMKGSVSQAKAINPAAFAHANYMKVLDSYTPAAGVWVSAIPSKIFGSHG
ncbi:MAG: dihydroorotate dehydrogenase-like protein [Pseudomonadota bacterium]